MSSEHEGGNGSRNEGGQPPHEAPGADPTGVFDAFRARQAEEREQQETQPDYTFPPEYAADPNALFPPNEPVTQRFATPYGALPGERSGASRKRRSAAILGGAVVLACALGFGGWAAFSSAGPASSDGTSAGGSATAKATAAGTAAGKRAKALSFRVAIRSVGADSFTGTVPATGETVTIALTGTTHYGTKAHPFSRNDLTSGEIVLVHGRRTGTDTVTATIVVADTAASASPGATGGATASTSGAAA
ncbi:MAG TPA: hypothetical protein VH372_15800 [Actinospica sp.]|jgi:hypothetical protein|nr:hypothetical protein [Actinospica sp.]